MKKKTPENNKDFSATATVERDYIFSLACILCLDGGKSDFMLLFETSKSLFELSKCHHGDRRHNVFVTSHGGSSTSTIYTLGCFPLPRFSFKC